MSQLKALVLKPEQRLLTCCARTDLSSPCKEHIHDLLRQPINWTYLLQIAQLHGLLPLLYHSLGGLRDSHTPEAFREVLQLSYLANVGRNVVFVRELFLVLDLLQSERIPSVPLKGPILAAGAYGNISLRQFCDLDILVRRQDVSKARNILNAAGYKSGFGLTPEAEDELVRYQKDFQFISPERGMTIELHWALEPGNLFRHFNDVSVWSRLTETAVEGRVLSDLGPEDSVLYLCLHGANHRWDRLCLISDVAQTLARYPHLDWELLEQEARKLQCRRSLFLGLSLAHTLMGAPLPLEVASRVNSYPGVRPIRDIVIDHLFSAPDRVSDLSRSFSFHLMVRETLRSKLQLCARRVFFPDALDFRTSRLPPALFFLLPVFRPLRLLVKHLASRVMPQSQDGNREPV